MSHDATRKTFFRQSGWMVFSVVLSGVLFYCVHFFAKEIPESEYGVFGTLLAVLNLMVGLQSVFAQQTAVSVKDSEKRELVSTARGVLIGSCVIWAVFSAAIFIFRDSILAGWHIHNPAALWLMLVLLLLTVFNPVFGGLLQGDQNFFWLGWSQIFNSVGRLVAVAVIVHYFGGLSTGMVAGILIGLGLSVTTAAWQSRYLWTGPGAPVHWKNWFSKVIPLVFGAGSFQFLFSADPIFVQYYSDGSDTGYYIAAGTLGRALCAFTGPVVAVMFPKIVRSSALARKSNFMGMTLVITAVMACIGAFGLTVIAPWFVPKFMYRPEYVAALPLLPWFSAAMVPLAISNVLLNDLLARSRFAVVPWVTLVAIGYAVALTQYHSSFTVVIQTLGVFSFMFLAVVGVLAWRDARVQRLSPESTVSVAAKS